MIPSNTAIVNHNRNPEIILFYLFFWETEMKRAIVIGATTGIGRELAILLVREGYRVGITGRRENLLQELHQECPEQIVYKRMDVARHDLAQQQLKDLIQELGGMDVIYLNAAIGYDNRALEWDRDNEIIDINVKGFVALAVTAMHYFFEQGYGHLVGISSISALRGYGYCPSYNASKAFISNYVEGLRHLAVLRNIPIDVTDVKPGFVDTPMIKDFELDKVFWVASAEKAARQIYKAVQKKKYHVYITKRWQLIAWLMKRIPEPIYLKG